MCTAPPDLSKIKNVQALLDHFGEWPCFHDSEVLYIHLDRGNINVFEMPTMEMALDLVNWPRFNEKKEFIMDTRVTLRFTASQFENIDGFNYQNAICGLEIKALEPDAGTGDVGGYHEVEISDAFGVYANFKCDAIEVVKVESITESNQRSIHDNTISKGGAE